MSGNIYMELKGGFMSKLKVIKKVLGIDFETACAARASACAVGLCVSDFATREILETRDILIDPETQFSPFNTLVHGISSVHVHGAPTFPQIAKIIRNYIDDDTVVVTHNASFDISVLRRSCERYDLPPLDCNFLCTLVMARAYFPGLVSYSLDALTDQFALPAFSHHNAGADAAAAVRLFYRLLDGTDCVTIEQIARRTGVRYGYIYHNYYKPCRRMQNDLTEHCAIPEACDDVHADAIECDATIDNEVVAGKGFTFTGILRSMPRSEAEALVIKHSGIVYGSTTKKTNYLVHGYNDPAFLHGHDKSSKLIKAESLIAKGADLQVIDEVEFLRMFENSCGQNS